MNRYIEYNDELLPIDEVLNKLDNEIGEKDEIIDQLTNNWNKLEEWAKEYMRKNEKWHTNELSTHDKQYYGDTYYNTNYILEKFLDKMKEIKGEKIDKD